MQDVNRVMGEPNGIAVTLLVVAWDMTEYLADLKAHLVISKGSKFITSDNPAFRYNQFCQDSRMDGAVGAKKKGFQLFIPLSPDIYMVLYDGSTYKIAGGDYRSRITYIKDTDVRALNRLQIISAQDALYFSNWEQRRITHEELLKARGVRDEYRADIQEFVSDEDERESIFMMQELVPNISLNLRCLRVRKRAMSIPIRNRHRLYRPRHARQARQHRFPQELARRSTKRYSRTRENDVER